jgi:hypothetical protein
MLAALPCYTQLGMASLLPGTSRGIDPAKRTVTVDGLETVGLDPRRELLKAKLGPRATALNAVHFMEMNTATDARVLIRDHEVVYIYHNTVDATGDNAATEAKTFAAVRQAITERFGPNPATWPAQGAIAVPVQMLETWLLLSLDPEATQGSLPLFSAAKNASAKHFYAGSPPPRLKDLLEIWRSRSSHRDLGSFILEIASSLNGEDLARKSASFALFQQDLHSWRGTRGS